MDNFLGDLADIVRASGGTGVINHNTTTTATTSDRFGLSNQDSYQLIRNDAYSFPADTLLRNIDAISTSSTSFLDNMGVDDVGQGGGRLASGADGQAQQVMGPSQTPGIINNGLCNIFSSNNMVQILSDSNNTSHKAIDNNGNNCSRSNNNDGKLPLLPAAAAAAASPKVVKAAAAAGYGFMSNQMISMNNASCSSSHKGAFVDGSTTTAAVQQLQIPSPRNHGIKRRKIQAKKVVCIPAPAAANSRQTGEVVPSDLWAWRKYGQKPIKGSPYPRGYYRCSSSKGCSARKQVERSRTDPNMLVITYTSEHNHPWPTQRNALAGSTRSSQPASKTSSKASSPPSQKPSNNKFRNILIKEENENVSTTATTLSTVKEEEIKLYDDRLDSNKVDEIIESYRPLILPEPKANNGRHQQADQDFFADLVEFESDDPLEIFGTQGCKGFGSFSGLFDWATNNNTPTNEENNDHTTLSLDQEKFER